MKRLNTLYRLIVAMSFGLLSYTVKPVYRSDNWFYDIPRSKIGKIVLIIFPIIPCYTTITQMY